MGRRVRVSLVWGSALLCALQLGQVWATKPVEAGYEAATEPQKVTWCNGRPGDGRSYCWRNCTSYVAYKLAKMGVQPADYTKLGHAKHWAAKAYKRGIHTGTTPRVGSVAYWTEGDFGHVAWVEVVYDDKSVLASSYNGFTESYYVQDRVRPEGYIYFSNVSTRPQPKVSLVQALQRARYVSSTLGSGQTLRTNQYLGPRSGRYGFVLQRDGNVVLYNRRFRPLWRTNSDGSDADKLVLQSDGNLVLYNGRRAVWQSRTVGRGGVRLAVQGDGNVVLYSKEWQPLWTTNTAM